jgi:hypothetical protein
MMKLLLRSVTSWRPVTFILSFSLVFTLLFARPPSAMPIGIIMFESDMNDIGGSELAFNTYQTFDDILNANSSSSMFSDINVNAPFSTTGLFIEPAVSTPVPEPATILMLGFGLAGLAGFGRKKLFKN